ncbi:MAG: NosD domain-containing protein [Candidatus Bathyarchaeia archaeon]
MISTLTITFVPKPTKGDESVGVWIIRRDMPTARTNLAAVSVDKKIYAIGGYTYDGGKYVATSLVEIYDVETDTWISTNPMPVASGCIGAVAIGNLIYVLCGETSQLFCYDTYSGEWSELAKFPAAANTGSFGMVAFGNKIYVARGSSNYPSGIYWTYCYDVLTNTWIEKSPIPYHRTIESLAVLNGKLYAIGGADPSLGRRVEVSRVDIYDPIADTWQLDAVQRMSVPRTHLEPETPVMNGKIYVIGGWDGYTELSTVEEFDPQTNSWKALTPMPTARYALATAVVDGKIYCIGGDSGGYGGNPKTANEELSIKRPIIIRADGSIDPHDAPIITHDNITYTLIDNITSYTDGIIIERRNIIIDGASYTIQGVGEFAQVGIKLRDLVNVTIKNFIIKNFDIGIHLYNVYDVIVTKNELLTCSLAGIQLDNSSNNIISENYFTSCGLYVAHSYNNIVTGNLVNGKPLVYLEEVSNFTVINAGQVILLRCDSIEIQDLELANASIGIQLWQTNNTSIRNNNISWNKLFGIYLYESSNNSISQNYVIHNEKGVVLENSANNNRITMNIVKDNTICGIRLTRSAYNLISCNLIGIEMLSMLDLNYNSAAVELIDADNNTIAHNDIDKYPYGVVLGDELDVYPSYEESSGNFLLNNTITGSLPIREFDGEYEIEYSCYGIIIRCSPDNNIAYNRIENTSTGILILDYNSVNNNISWNKVINNCEGIVCCWTASNKVSGNIISNNYVGIGFYEYVTGMLISENSVTNNNLGIGVEGSFNILYKNVISNNDEGLYLFGGENIIYHNSFINNTCQANVGSFWRTNFWDVGYPFGGNHWSDYSGVDEKSGCDQDQPGSDGICDTPYYICENNVDRYPFMRPEFPTAPISKPFVVLSASSTVVKEDVEGVVFTAFAYDFDGYIESYLFDYGDGHNSGWIGDSSVSWIYSNPGNYLAKVKVRDNDGIESDWSYLVNITVISIAKPVAILSASPTTVKEDVESVTFDASSSYDPDGTIVSYYFSFGDGSESGWISNSKVSKVYSNPGTYWAKVKVKDNEGLESDWSSPIKITVTALPPPPPENQKPIARLLASPTTVEEDYQSVILDASASYDLDGSVIAYWFDYGDGTNSGWVTNSKISKIYNNIGEYYVKVKVKDNDGSESDWSETIKIKVVASPDPYIPDGGIVVLPSTPKMGERYTINVKVFNPSAVKKSVSIYLQETGVKTGYNDIIYPTLTQGPYEIGPCQSLTFTFSLKHKWDWLHPFELPGWVEFVLKEFLNYVVVEGFEVYLPGFVYSLLIKSITLAGATHEAVYSYTITSNIKSIKKEILVKVEVPQSKRDHIFASAQYTIVGSVLTAMGIPLTINPILWPFGAALLTSQVICVGLSKLEWEYARDPPDLNYTSIASKKSITLPQLEEINNTKAKELAESFLALYADLEAAKVSFERYQGANIMNDTEWMLRQLEAAHLYMNMAINDLLAIRTGLNSLLADIQSTGFSLNSTVIQNIKGNLTNGLPPLEVEILRAFNFTDEEINAIHQGLLGTPDAILLNYTDTLKMLDCLIPTFVNITASLMEQQHRIRTAILNETGILTYLIYVNEQLFSIHIESNSTITGFYFDHNQKIIRFNVEGFSETVGFCNVTIPKNLLKGEPWAVTLNGTNWDFILTENETHNFLYITYTHTSTYEIVIQGTWVIPEFSPNLIIPLFVILSVTVLLLKKKRALKVKN